MQVHRAAKEERLKKFKKLAENLDQFIIRCLRTGLTTDFSDDMTTAMKAVDHNHMVDLGVPGGCASETKTDYTTIVGGQVDLCDVWHDYVQAATALPSQMQQRIDVCQNLNKPSFVGESGICADIMPSQACSGTITTATLQQRAIFFDAKLSAAFKAGLAGYIIWNKGSQSVEDDIGPGDPTERVLAKYALYPHQVVPQRL